MATELQQQLRPASFRGVGFFIDPQRGIELQGGRRGQINEYPQRDLPYVQDLGRSVRLLEFEAFIVGADYIEQSKTLLGALEAFGPGKLIHPWLGDLTVNVQTYRVRYDHGLGHVRFDLSLVESGELTFPTPATATAAASREAATEIQMEGTSWFSSVMDVVGFVDRVATFALDTYAEVLGIIANPIGAAAGLFGISADVIDEITGVADDVTGLVSLFSQPDELGNRYAGLLNLAPKAADGALAPQAATAAERDAVYLPMLRGQVAMAMRPDLAPPPPSTSAAPSVRQQTVNDAAIRAHTRLLLIGNAVGLSSLVSGAVYDDVIAARAELLAAIDVEMVRASNDDVYRSLSAARGAAYADLTAKARDSARLLTVTVPGFTPAVVVAYDRYEDATRDAEIVARNRIKHPGFVRGDVRVLSR